MDEAVRRMTELYGFNPMDIPSGPGMANLNLPPQVSKELEPSWYLILRDAASHLGSALLLPSRPNAICSLN